MLISDGDRRLAGSERHPLILGFPDITADMLPLVGGKAANLGVLTRAGLPVPAGLCLTTRAYRRVAEGAGLSEVLDALARTAADDTAALAELAGRARAAVLAAPVPPDIARAVREAADGPVAVRSSATAEDLPDASFAGQQDTFLNVVGPDAVLDAVRRCWASLWTDRAVAYRAAAGIDHGAVHLAVVIQRMVAAEVAGVMFTANPVTGRRREVVIDAAPGLGEAVVSGAVNPDHFVVSPSGAIVERRPGDKRTEIRPVAGGGTEQVRREGASGPCLTDEQVVALARLGARVEDHYGAPQDTEWAIDASGTLWLTQARPITTLYPLPEPAAGGLRVYFCFSLAQGLHRPITPMGMSAFRALAGSAITTLYGPRKGPLPVHYAGMRIFGDVTGIMRGRVGRAIVPRMLDVMEARSAVVLRGLFDDPRLSVTHRSPLPAVRRLARVARRYRIPLRILQDLRDPATARQRVSFVVTRLRERLALHEGATAAERLDHVEHCLSSQVVPLIPNIVPAPAAGFLMFGLATRLLRGRTRPGELPTVLRGLPHNVTTEMDLALWEAAERIRVDEAATRALSGPDLPRGALPPVLREELDRFLHRYGHRAVAEIDLGVPRWSDDPSHVLGVLANYLRLDDPALAPDVQFARGAREAEDMIDTLARRAGVLRGPLVRFALRRTRELAGYREMPKYCFIVALGEMRRHLAAVGAELAARGLLAEPDDVFMLTIAEARAGLGGADRREPVRERRAAYERELRRRHIPRVLLSDGTEPEAVGTAAPVEGALTGTPASPGSVTGKARVVLDPVGAHLAPGEILVAPSTDPGWTPLFLTAGGLVMEMGGANSHGAVVAREYGIPAVVGVPDATSRIATGDEITVDGTGGAVVLPPVKDAG
ncbi:phosphoenolpyruvate synthase [Sphaerisporangium melleum]|uniref:Phosphoenolpyruvate synthase n=1 Tax=Sphaerisporangium melleum TaxID=321316 RepID=A0A917VUB4_9ACTN|nr:PEP/pyruvate-binding domain-containing protein [Sphaerisporangium melleum]GGL15304.1 phosphoenolpyruvate synthase [Sphaerisporangium melleum]GII74541.1 phosphoenolpyruvate synthase [Sphaerisporangium melleum]